MAYGWCDVEGRPDMEVSRGNIAELTASGLRESRWYITSSSTSN
jgi:hypothetical protein